MARKKSGIINSRLYEKKAIFEIQSHIEYIEKDLSLYEEKNFDQRTDGIDFIEFQIIDQIQGLLKETDQPDQLLLLKQWAEKIRSELEEMNVNLFQKLHVSIRREEYKGKGFKNLVDEYVEVNLKDNDHQQEAGYDNLDIFINELLSPLHAMPEQIRGLEPGMVFYQKTPARIVFELVEKCKFTNQDVFYDLGSGLGQVTILVNLLAGVITKGVEFEPAFCVYSQNCAEKLNLSNITFINADARQANYSDGTVFFMYTPFYSEILQEVLEVLRKESLMRKIRIITYGPCTAEIASQSWLDSVMPYTDNIYKLHVFTSLQN